jgi:hypothetical protein
VSSALISEPGFILETEYTDWKTSNWRSIKRAADPQRDTPD